MGGGEIGLRSGPKAKEQRTERDPSVLQSRGGVSVLIFGLETLLHARKGASCCNSCIPFAEVWTLEQLGTGCQFHGICLCRDLHSGLVPVPGADPWHLSRLGKGKVSRAGWGRMLHAMAGPAGARGQAAARG